MSLDLWASRTLALSLDLLLTRCRPALLCSLAQCCQLLLHLDGAPDRLLALSLGLAPGGVLA